jgi:Zn-dependent protease
MRLPPLRLHPSFLVLAALFIGWELVTAGLSAALTASVFGVALFGSVALHELGHALMAMHFGIRTRSITLYPFGGIAALEREPLGRAELWIALAGPLVNFGLGGLGLALMGIVPGAGVFAALNVGMGLFNLLPAFPMDGGRVIRAWWTREQGHYRATHRALKVSRWFAWGFIGLAVVTGAWNLALVGVFLHFMVRSEANRLRFS